MPHNRRQYNKRPSGNNYNKYSGYLSTADKALRVALSVRKLVNVEYRSIITPFLIDPNTTGATVDLSAIAQGDDVANRQGNKVRAKYLSIRGFVAKHASATNTQLRMMVVRDNNGSTTPPTIGSLFTTVTVFRQNKNKRGDPQTNSRFSVLWDKFIILDDIKQIDAQVNFSMSLDHHIFFSGTAATDEGKGHLWLLIASSEATNDPIVTVDSMLKFIDN